MVWRHQRAARLLAVGIAVCLSGIAAMGFGRRVELNPHEQACVGTWSFRLHDRPTTLVVYHFGRDRRVCEEHYYLNSGTPAVPRIRMLGQWHVDHDNRLVVERSSGVRGLTVSASGLLDNALNNDTRLARPVLTRFYWLKQATAERLVFRASGDAKGTQIEIVMTPYTGAEGVARVTSPK